jgi:hypothetical protein
LVPGSLPVQPKHYRVILRTGDVRGAGTDANVFIILHGSKGSTGLFSLETAANNFERGACDEFAFKASDVGNIESIEIGHDGETRSTSN